MKKRLFILLFSVHLLLVFFQALWATIDSYWIYHYNESPYVPVLIHLKQNSHTELYYLMSGINTGYGFYGIKASSEKYLKVTFLDSSENVLKSDRYFGLSTSNGVSRLKGFASYLANHIGETEKMIEIDTSSVSSENLQEIIQFRKEYISKVLKWLGKNEASNISNCVSYKVDLLTIVPESDRQFNTKPKLYVIQKGYFPVQ